MSGKYQRELKRLARDYGREFSKASKHFHLTCPRGERLTVMASCSPSCPHALKNVERDLIKYDVRIKEGSHPC